jgi:ribosome-binding factor A
VAAELTLKHTPAIAFLYDDSVDRGMRITELLDRPDVRERIDG